MKHNHNHDKGRSVQARLEPVRFEFTHPTAGAVCVVVDGKWMPDPLAKETVPNPFGGRNSLLKVSNAAEASPLAAAENSPKKNTNQQKPEKL